MVRSFNELKKRWDDHVSFRHYQPGIVIKDAGLVLGADTILVRMGETSSGAKSLAGRSRSGAASEFCSVFRMGIEFRPASSRISKRHRNNGGAAIRF